MTNLYIVRHVEAQGNKDGRYHGITNSGLTENGIAQLKSLEEYFKNIKIDAIYTSPLKRAVYTADAINKYHGLTIKFCNDLHEIDGGELEGVAWSDFPVLYPDIAKMWNNEPYNYKTEKGESMRDVYNRVSKAVMTISENEKNRNIAIISHACAVKNIICFLHGKTVEKIGEEKWFSNGSVSLFKIDGNGKIESVYENDTSHLSKTLDFSDKLF